jgi:hypothetical protein
MDSGNRARVAEEGHDQRTSVKTNRREKKLLSSNEQNGGDQISKVSSVIRMDFFEVFSDRVLYW